MTKTAQSVPLIPTPEPTPPGGWTGWKSFYGNYPWGYSMVEAWRREWDRSEVIVPAQMHPLTNIANLYWRPVAEGGEAIN